MSLLARFAGQDPVQLVRLGAAISLTVTDAPGFSYNFPLMLFGVIALELSSTGPEQFFLMLSATMGIFDILNLLSRPPPGLLAPLFAVILTVLKLPIYLSGTAHLRERGGELAWSSRGFAPQTWIPTSMGGGEALGGTPVHTSAPSPAPPPAQTGSFPSGGYRLGSGDDTPRAQQTRDGYTSIA